MEFLILGVFWIIVLGGVGYWIAQQKRRREVEGAALGCLLGPIGWIIEAVLPTGAQRSDSVWRADLGGYEPELVFTEAAHPDLVGEEATDDALRQARDRVARQTREGQVLLEAVWRDEQRTNISLAFGSPDISYARYLDGEDVKGLIGPPAVAASDEPTMPRRGDSRLRPEALDGGPTKTCPDCAEAILEAARICRFCRHEFWPEDVPPPEPPGDVLDADEGASPPDDSSVTDGVPDADTQVTEEDVPPEPEPTTPELAAPEPPAPEPEAPGEQEETPPPAPPPPGYAPPPPSYPPPPPPPAGRPAPPPYTPQEPPYAPPPPGWQPPPQGRPPGQAQPGQGQGPWVPPPRPRPPDRPRE